MRLTCADLLHEGLRDYDSLLYLHAMQCTLHIMYASSKVFDTQCKWEPICAHLQHSTATVSFMHFIH